MRRVQRRPPGEPARTVVAAVVAAVASACSSTGVVEVEIGNPPGGRALFAVVGSKADFEKAQADNAPEQILQVSKLAQYTFYLQVSPREEPSLHWEVDDPQDKDADVDFELPGGRETLELSVDGKFEEQADRALAVILDCGSKMELVLFRASDFAARATHLLIARNGQLTPAGN